MALRPPDGGRQTVSQWWRGGGPLVLRAMAMAMAMAMERRRGIKARRKGEEVQWRSEAGARLGG